MKPEFIRLPKEGKLCPHTGLSRGYMNQLILPTSENGHKPPVRSHSIRKRGNVRGIRLIVYDSLIDHLNQLTESKE